MLINHITKEKVRARKPRRILGPAFSYHVVEGASEAEIQQRLERAFGILFNEVLRRRELKSNPQNGIDNNRQLRT